MKQAARRWSAGNRRCERRLCRRWPARRDTGGFTIVETLVTLFLLSIVLVPMTVVAYRSLNAATTSGSREGAAGLATSVLAHLKAGGYANVGFSSAQIAGQAASYRAFAVSGVWYWDQDGDGDASPDAADQQLVLTSQPAGFTLGSAQVPFAPALRLTTTGTPYTVTTHVYWDSATVPNCSQSTSTEANAYKHAVVTVSWQNGTSELQTVTQDEVIYPGGLTTYSGPSYVTGNVPATPGNPTGGGGVEATPTNVSGEITVSWTLPLLWTSLTSCFSVGWSNNNNVGSSSGILATSALTLSPPAVPTQASWTVTGLQQGGPSQVYTFYVTAYSPDGIESAESADSAETAAPQGPIVTGVSPVSGPSGTSVTLTGTGFSTPTTQVEFCPAGQSCAATFVSANCSSAASCTVGAPAALAGAQGGVFNVIAETPTGPAGAEITSPPSSGSQFTYTPAVADVTPANKQAGGTVTVTGTNLFGQTTFWFGTPGASGSLTGTNGGCDATFQNCTVTVPNGVSGTTVDVYAVNGTVASAQNAGDKFKFA